MVDKGKKEVMDSVLPDRRAGFGRARNINSELNGDFAAEPLSKYGQNCLSKPIFELICST